MAAPSRHDPALKAQETQLLRAALEAEALVDQEILRLNSLQADDLDLIRERRMRLMKLEYEQQQQFIAKGHGKYSELQDEKDFFADTKKSRNVIVHFYRPTTWRCQIVDKHMEKLAPVHTAAKFVKINAEKAPFLSERLKVWTLPTILVIRDGAVSGRIEGFGPLGDRDDFSTKTLEKVLNALGAFNKNATVGKENLDD